MTDDTLEALKDEIEAHVDRLYEEKDRFSMRVGILQELVARTTEYEPTWNEVRAACDSLVEDGRLVFLRDKSKGRRYCSTDVPDEKLQHYKQTVQGDVPPDVRDGER